MVGKVVLVGMGGEVGVVRILLKRPRRLLGIVATVGMRRQSRPEKCRPKRWLWSVRRRPRRLVGIVVPVGMRHRT
jgi:hypothetical protein